MHFLSFRIHLQRQGSGERQRLCRSLAGCDRNRHRGARRYQLPGFMAPRRGSI